MPLPRTARPRTCNCWITINKLRDELRTERRLRIAAEQNAARFHAQALAARINKVAA